MTILQRPKKRFFFFSGTGLRLSSWFVSLSCSQEWALEGRDPILLLYATSNQAQTRYSIKEPLLKAEPGSQASEREQEGDKRYGEAKAAFQGFVPAWP